MDVNELIDALGEIKSITKRVPASGWTPEFREIANKVFSRPIRHDDTNLAFMTLAFASRQGEHAEADQAKLTAKEAPGGHGGPAGCGARTGSTGKCDAG